MNESISGLLETGGASNFLLTNLAGLPRALQYQVLDDAAATIGGDPHHRGLRERIELQILHWHQRGTGLIDESLPGDLKLALSQTSLTLESDAARDRRRRFRLMTHPVEGRFRTSILIRGPQHLIGGGRAGNRIVDEFGKIVAALWTSPVDEARRTLRLWNSPGDRDAFNSEVRAFSSSRRRARFFIAELARQGFVVKYAPIPVTLAEARVRSDQPSEDRMPFAYWIVGTPSQQPLTRWLLDLVSEQEGGSIHHLEIGDRAGVAPGDEAAEAILLDLFHRPIFVTELTGNFHIDVPGYRTERFKLDRYGETGVSLCWDIATLSGETAGTLRGWIPDIPPAGTPWIAWGESFNAELEDKRETLRLAQHVQRGIGRRAMQKILKFLFQLGLNALDIEARQSGLAFMPHIGFDFVDESSLREAKTDFRNFLDEVRIHLSPAKKIDLGEIRYAWEFVDFQLEDGRHVGREFLDHYGRVKKKTIRLRFQLNPHYEGWRRLFGRQLNHTAAAREAPRKIESEERRQAAELRQIQAQALITEQPWMDPRLPPETRRALRLLAERVLEVDELARQARFDARLDPLTELLNRRALMEHHRELELAMTSRREDEPKRPHAVLMIDIDRFKAINDRHGHPAGDEVIKTVARIIEESIRDEDIAARYGGEEFCAILRHAGLEGGRRVAELIRHRVASEAVQTAGQEILTSVSIGLAPFRLIPEKPSVPSGEPGNPFEEPREEKTSLSLSIEDADRALYRAKRSGRNRVVEEDP